MRWLKCQSKIARESIKKRNKYLCWMNKSVRSYMQLNWIINNENLIFSWKINNFVDKDNSKDKESTFLNIRFFCTMELSILYFLNMFPQQQLWNNNIYWRGNPWRISSWYTKGTFLWIWNVFFHLSNLWKCDTSL